MSCIGILLTLAFHPVLPQWHVKDTGHSAKSAGDRLHLNTHTPLTHRSRSGLTMPLSRQSVGIYQETSSHATRLGTLGHSRLSSLSHHGLILAQRVELVCASYSPLLKKCRWRGMNSRTSSQNPRKQGKSRYHHLAAGLVFMFPGLTPPHPRRLLTE